MKSFFPPSFFWFAPFLFPGSRSLPLAQEAALREKRHLFFFFKIPFPSLVVGPVTPGGVSLPFLATGTGFFFVGFFWYGWGLPSSKCSPPFPSDALWVPFSVECHAFLFFVGLSLSRVSLCRRPPTLGCFSPSVSSCHHTAADLVFWASIFPLPLRLSGQDFFFLHCTTPYRDGFLSFPYCKRKTPPKAVFFQSDFIFLT